MSSPSPQAVKKDFGLQHGRMTLPPALDPAISPGANYIAAASNSLPIASSTPIAMQQYKITWSEKVRSVFRFKKKKKGDFNTDPDISHYPQPFSRATGAMVHSTPKIFDPSRSVENLAQNSCASSDEDISPSLLEDTQPGKVPDKQKAKTKIKSAAGKDSHKQISVYVGNEDESSKVDPLLFEANESAGRNSSNRTHSPSDLSDHESSIREASSQQLSSDISSSEDEPDVVEKSPGNRKISAVTSSEWQQKVLSQNKKRKKSTHSMEGRLHLKVDMSRPLSAGHSNDKINQDGSKLSRNLSDGITDEENRQSKKKRPGRVKGPHKSRENLGRPTILDADLPQQEESQPEQQSVEDGDTFDFGMLPQTMTRLNTSAAHDKCKAAKNIKRRKATTKRSLFLHTDEELKYGTTIVDPSSTVDPVTANKLQQAEQIVQHLRRRSHTSTTSASIVAKAAEQKRSSTENNPVDLADASPELSRTDSKKRFSMSLLINKQILESPLKKPAAPSPSPKPKLKEPNFLEHVKLKPISNSPIKAEPTTNATTVVNDINVSSVQEESKLAPLPATKEKPRKAVLPTKDKIHDLASPVKENRTTQSTAPNSIPKLTPVELKTNNKMDAKEAAVVHPTQDVHLPPISEHKRTKSRRNKTVGQPVKAIGYMKDMKDAPSKPAWIEIAQRKTQRVSEALSSIDKLPQLSSSPIKHNEITLPASPESSGTETIKDPGLPTDGYVQRRLRTFSHDRTPKAT